MIEGGRVIITAERKSPFVSRLGFSTGSGESRPRNPAFHGPAFILILPIIQGPVQLDGRLHAQSREGRETLIAAAAARWKKQLQRRVRRIHLEFVIGEAILHRLEE